MQDAEMYKNSIRYLLGEMKDPDSTQVISAIWVVTKSGRNLAIEYRSRTSAGGYNVGKMLYLSEKSEFKLIEQAGVATCDCEMASGFICTDTEHH